MGHLFQRIFSNYTLFVLFCCLFSGVFCERSVPARTDICQRIPDFSGCPKSASAQQPGSPAVAPAPAAATTAAAPTTTPIPTPAPTSASTKAKGPTTQSPEIQKLCQQYAGLAAQYCVGAPNELPVAREKCEYWRKYCKNTPTATQSPLGGPPCAPYEVQYLTLCVQQQPVSQEIAVFCYAYRKNCIYGKKPALLNPGFNAPVGRPLVPAASSTVVDPFPAPWSSIYTFDQRKATLLDNGPVQAVPNLAPPWSSQPSVAGLSNPDQGPIGSIPVNQALSPDFQSGFAPNAKGAPAPFGAPVQPVLPTLPVNPSVPAAVPQVPSSVFPSANPGVGVGSSTQVGPFAGVNQGTQVNPFSGVSSGTGVNAAGLPISSGGGVGFGGLIPNVGVLGRRRRRRAISLMTILKIKNLM